MPFIGKQQAAGFATTTKQDLTPDGSTVAFSLNKPAASANDIEVFVGNVRQEPTDAYTVSGTTLTMSAAPASGLNFYVLFKEANQSATVPAAGTSVPGAFSVEGTLDVGDDLTIENADPVLYISDTNAVAGGSSGAHVDFRDGSNVRTGYVGHGSSGSTNLLLSAYQSDVIIQADLNNESAGSVIDFKIDNSRVAQFTPDGLSFDNGSNALDDYEEGTLSWVVKKTDGTAGTDNGSSVKYTKIGQVVFIVGKLRYDNNTASGAGELEIVGSLPFVPNVTGGIPITHIRSEDGSPSTMAAVTFASGSSNVFIHQSGNDYDTNDNNLGAATQTNLVLEFNGHYTTSS